MGPSGPGTCHRPKETGCGPSRIILVCMVGIMQGSLSMNAIEVNFATLLTDIYYNIPRYLIQKEYGQKVNWERGDTHHMQQYSRLETQCE